MKRALTMLSLIALAVALCGTAFAGECPYAKAASAAAAAPAPQRTCPIMGGEVNKDVYYDYQGCRIYACCPACLEKIKADPQAAVAKIKANGEQPFQVICTKCGELKGTGKCCQPGVEKCPKCGLDKDSPGCCCGIKQGEGDGVVVCPMNCASKASAAGTCCDKAKGAKDAAKEEPKK
jgi:hypothetical protein